MSVKKIILKEGLILLGFFLSALLLFIFLEDKFPDATQLHLKIAFFIFIILYALRWVLRIFKGLMLVLFVAALAGIVWLLLKFPPLHLF